MNAARIVAFNDFTGSDTSADLAAVRRVLESGWLVLGNEVRYFEEAWAARCGVEHAVGVGNGLDAIEIGLRALEIGPGDEVITTSMTAVATVLGILRAGATPVLADIDPATALLDPASVERCITPATKAILLVHLYGQVRDMAAWAEMASAYGVLLLEDCAQAHDALDAGRVAGSWGDFGAYSFYPTKNLGAAGDAGAIVTSRSDLAVAAASIRNYGQSNRYEHPIFGMNSRLDEVQAAILSTRLSSLTELTARRRSVARCYWEGLSNPFVATLTPPLAAENHVHHLFVVTSDHRDALQAHLDDAGVQTLIHYPVPAHQQESLKHLRTDPNGLAHTELHARTCLSLPCAAHLTDEDASYVIDAVNAYRPA